MIVALREVPAEERHLLFCTTLGVRRRRREARRRRAALRALNRSLALQPDARPAPARMSMARGPCMAPQLGVA